jgi:hypothetical protein
MLRRTPLRAKPRYKPVAAERHHDRIAALGCLVCGGPAEVHHVTGYADKPGRFSRDHWLTAPLCPLHHRGVGEKAPMLVSVQSLGHQGFYEEHGIDLLAEAMRLAEETQRRAA